MLLIYAINFIHVRVVCETKRAGLRDFFGMDSKFNLELTSIHLHRSAANYVHRLDQESLESYFLPLFNGSSVNMESRQHYEFLQWLYSFLLYHSFTGTSLDYHPLRSPAMID